MLAAQLLAVHGVTAVELVTVGRVAVELVVTRVVAGREVLVAVDGLGELVLGVVVGCFELLGGWVTS